MSNLQLLLKLDSQADQHTEGITSGYEVNSQARLSVVSVMRFTSLIFEKYIMF